MSHELSCVSRLFQSIFSGHGSDGELVPGSIVKVGKKSLTIANKLGEGGFASVYLCTQKHQRYAIKHCKCMSQEQISLIEHEVDVLVCASIEHSK